MSRLALLLFLVLGCSSASSPNVPAVTVPSAEPSAEPGAGPPDAAPAPLREPIRLELDQSVTLVSPTGDEEDELRFASYTEESIAADPEGRYPAGVGTTVQLLLGGENVPLTDLSNGYQSTNVYWLESYRVELVAHGTGKTPWVHLHVDTFGEPTEPRTARVERNGSINLGGGRRLWFERHGHKHMPAGGGSSPLILRLVYEEAGQKEDDDVALDLPDHSTWTWHDLHFRLLDHEYDSFMSIEIRRRPRIALQPQGS